jgi:mycobactin lysine-N-oxygenase
VNPSIKRLLILGAGPKAVAISAKAYMLRELGVDAPEVLVVEKSVVGANWCGDYEYTDGSRVLATSPEKDLGYPYRSGFLFGLMGPAVASKMLSDLPGLTDGMLCYSWAAYLIAIGEYHHWIDRGRPRPTHLDLAAYFAWAAKQCMPNWIKGTVTRIEPQGSRWAVTFEREKGERREGSTETVDGVVITGPGTPETIQGDDQPFVSNGQTFWRRPVLDGFRKLDKGRIAVIGGGDTSAVVVTTLLDILPRLEDVRIDVFTKTGLTFSRDVGYGVTKYFSDPEGWNRLSWESRDQLLKRTLRNSVSEVSASILSRARNIDVRLGEIASLVGHSDGVEVHFTEGKPQQFDRVVLATGFNPLSCAWLFPKEMFPRGLGYRETIERVSQRIQADMSYRRKLTPAKCHLPMLADRKQGPGFPTLECLGLLSDRILSAYL